MGVSTFYTIFVSNILILKRIQRDATVCIGFHVKVPLFLSYFDENLIFGIDLRKISK